MKDDYLWDGAGEPDPDIKKLENALSKYSHQGQAPEFPDVLPPSLPTFWQRILPRHWSLGFAVAAATATVLLIAAFGILRWNQLRNGASEPGWEVERVAGTPRVESKLFGKSARAGSLGVGQTLVTDNRSQATISVAEVGTVSVQPNTRLRVLVGAQGRHQLALDRGTIEAFIWAAPGDFTVDTPSALAVDLGCRYTLHVDDSGAGLLRTTLGWVGFKLNGREAFIPAGAVCATRPNVGPGTPYFEDSSSSFRDSLSRFDFGSGTQEQRSVELDGILKEARPRDALTLWHLLARVGQADRGRVYDRLAALVPPPTGVTRNGVLRLDQNMLDLWWNQLDLGDVSLWRTWERSWSSGKS